jgi:hypothetical protein
LIFSVSFFPFFFFSFFLFPLFCLSFFPFLFFFFFFFLIAINPLFLPFLVLPFLAGGCNYGWETANGELSCVGMQFPKCQDDLVWGSRGPGEGAWAADDDNAVTLAPDKPRQLFVRRESWQLRAFINCFLASWYLSSPSQFCCHLLYREDNSSRWPTTPAPTTTNACV